MRDYRGDVISLLDQIDAKHRELSNYVGNLEELLIHWSKTRSLIARVIKLTLEIEAQAAKGNADCIKLQDELRPRLTATMTLISRLRES